MERTKKRDETKCKDEAKGGGGREAGCVLLAPGSPPAPPPFTPEQLSQHHKHRYNEKLGLSQVPASDM